MSEPSEPEPRYEERGLIENLVLICTWRVVVIYVAGPLVFWPWFWYTLSHLSDESLLPPKAQLVSAIAIMLVGVGFMCVEHDRIKVRLGREGYVQRRTLRREIDYYLNLAVFGGYFYWVFHGMRAVEVTSEHRLYAFMAGSSFMTTLGLEYWLLGSTIWFTSKREAP